MAYLAVGKVGQGRLTIWIVPCRIQGMSGPSFISSECSWLCVRLNRIVIGLPPRISVEQGRAVVVYGDRIVGRQAESC